jgi:hypothetical protein
MSKCDLQILPERPDRTYKFGEPIAGTVRIAAHDHFPCRKLTLIREWKTAGRGNRAGGGEEGMILADNVEFHSGETREYPFRFVGLSGPASYDGHYLKVVWHLRAQVDIPLAVDVKHEEKFLLVAGETSEEILLGVETPAVKTPATAGELAERMTMAKMLAIPFFLIGLAMIYLSHWQPVMLAIGVAVAGFGGWQIFFMLKNKLAQQKVGAVEVEISRGQVRPGEQVECKVLLPASHARRLQNITATLKGEERVVSGLGNHKTTHTHTIQNLVVEAGNQNGLSVANDKMQFTLPLQIPANAPSTFHAPDNALHWAILVRVDIPDWPDWVREFSITILP